MTTPHPYYPLSLAMDTYVAPTQHPLTLVCTIGTALALVLLLSYILVLRPLPLPRSTMLTAQWFVLCGSLHCVFELYYLAQFTALPENTDIMASLWKEYAKSDSRYLTQSSMVGALESVTVVVVGPLCWLVVVGICSDSPVRWLAQLVASVLHVYSVVLYFATEIIASESSCRPEPLYYYGYFYAMNAPWLVVPLWLATSAAREIHTAMHQAMQKPSQCIVEKKKKG